MRRAASSMFLTVVILAIVIRTPLAHTQDTWYGSEIVIMPDGSVYPETAPITREGNVYTLTADIVSCNKAIIVKKDGIILDGAGHIIQGVKEGTGIYVEDVSYVTIKNLVISDFLYGIKLRNSSNNVITAVSFINCGLFVAASHNNTVRSTTVNGKPLVYMEDSSGIVSGEGVGQVILVDCHDVIVENVNIQNTTVGIEVYNSTNCIISNNVIKNDKCGIYLWLSNNMYVINNTVENNDLGIILTRTNNSFIANNVIDRCNFAITLDLSSNNTICGNIIKDSRAWAMTIFKSSNNTIYHNNFINNSGLVNSGISSANKWDNGYPSGGNYWSDYKGEDKDSDGIGDTPYTVVYFELCPDKVDRYPLMEPVTEPETVPTPAISTPTPTPEEEGISTGVLVGIIVVVLVIAAIGAFIAIRRR